MHKLIHLEETDSTNLRLKDLAPTEENGTVVYADRQTAGRGRFERVWQSEKDGAWFSVLVKDNGLDAAKASFLVFVCAQAAQKALAELTQCKDIKIKWPNDIVCGGKKMAGILCESGFDGSRLSWSVCGIGINLLQENFPESLPWACSVLSQTGVRLSVKDVIDTFLKYFDEACATLLAEGPEPILRENAEHSATLGRDIRVTCGDASLTGKALRLEPDGSLAVLTDEGVFVVRVGDVSVRGIMGYV